MTTNEIDKNSSASEFTEHIRTASLRLPIDLYVKFCQEHPLPEKKSKPRPPKKTAKAIVGLDVIEVPSCISQYWPAPTKEVKDFVRKRDNYTCQICGEWGNVVDHIKPLRISHDSSPENLRVLCRYHNIITRMQRRDARLDFDTWAKLLKESVTPIYLLPPAKVTVQSSDYESNEIIG